MVLLPILFRCSIAQTGSGNHNIGETIARAARKKKKKKTYRKKLLQNGEVIYSRRGARKRLQKRVETEVEKAKKGLFQRELLG